MAMTLEEMELETAEFIPAREVMWCCYGSTTHQSNTAIVGSGDGNTYQSGGGLIVLNVSALNGNFDGNFNHVSQHNSSY